MIFYQGREFPEWQQNALIGGLSSNAIVRGELKGDRAREVERFEMGERIRAIRQSTDGVIWVLEDGRPPQFGKGWEQGGGRLLKLTAATEKN